MEKKTFRIVAVTSVAVFLALGLSFCGQNLDSFCVWGIVSGNNPPQPPALPRGPATGEVGMEYTYCTSATDPDGDYIYYLFDWDDGTWLGWEGPFASGDEVCGSHRWSERRRYEVRVLARDSRGAKGEWSDPLSISVIIQEKPEMLDQPVGPTSGEPGMQYTYSISPASDGDHLSYWIEWGDGTNSGWVGPGKSGDEITDSHVWNEEGTYEIQIKAKDIHGAESEWSEPLRVSILSHNLPESAESGSWVLVPLILGILFVVIGYIVLVRRKS